MAEVGRRQDDLTWEEVGQLAWRYLRIPAALILVEAIYWFLTMPSDTLAPIQTTEAWLWHHLTNLIFGDVSTLSTHNGWTTRVDLYHASFPQGVIALYVSDECAGIHEMLFLSTLVLLTDRVEWKLKVRSIAVMCAIIYVLNITRLLVLYPLAVNGCVDASGSALCATPMWEFHTFVYKWGFLMVLVSMWLLWFFWVGGPNRISDSSKQERGPFQISIRNEMGNGHWVAAILGILFITLAIQTALSDADFLAARAANSDCTAFEEVSQSCAQAERTWNDELGYVWSLATIGILSAGGAFIDFSRNPSKPNGSEEE